MTFQQITAPEDIGSSLNVLEYMSSDTHNSSSWEKRYIRKDGTPVWVRVTISTLRDGEGRPLHYIALIEDIQARKAAEERLAATKEALQVSEERYRTVFQTSQDCISISHAEDGRFVDVNPTFLSMFGYEREEVIGRTALELNIWTGPEDRLKLVNALQGSVCRDISLQFARRNGERFWALLSGARIDLDGIPSFLLVVRDISDAKTAAEALRVSEERYRTAFQTSLDSININRLSDGMYIDCNQAFLDTLGYSREEVIGKTSLEMGVWADGRDRQNMVEMVRQQASCRGLEVQFRKKKGEYFWGQMSASPMEIDGVACILTVTRDLSQSKAAESEIRSLAFYDPLTGLPNRRLLLERLRQALAASGRSGHSQALLLVDLDNFKTLNETLGHETGDLLLQEAARRVVACAHEGDMVCRLGGDEFVVMLEDLSEVAEEAAAKARAVGEKILALVGQPYLIEERECRMTASIGITVFGNRENSTDAIMQQTDIALDQAKAAGRNSMRFFSPDLQAAVNARATLEEELRQAIKTQQFLLYYQPQVERGRLTGTEALIRWQHPRRGLVPPDEFIPLAEESRLILPLGDWVLQAACAQIALWAKRRNTAHLTLAVNISALQFRQPEFVETVLAALERTGANPKKLKLELTESILVENIEEVIIKMTELKSHGLSFSLDDFGTGYSSLAYLKRLPLDQLKIDRAFVRDMLVDATSGAIAQTILSLGDAMGLSVVAEGVESEEQRGFLAGLGCTSFQGYLFSRALPLDAFEAYLKGFNRPSARDRK
jgi:diguanylate cyclase (GGDEF)-like protein/PAS domain S-box-containing protein